MQLSEISPKLSGNIQAGSFPDYMGVLASCSRLDAHPKGIALNFKAPIQFSCSLPYVANKLQT